MIIDCISDLHGHYPPLEGGDLLIVAGDLTAHDKQGEYEDFHNWLHELKLYKRVIVIPGNHDGCFEKNIWGENFQGLQSGLVTYLCDSGTEFVVYPQMSQMEEGKIYERPKVKIWGSPWTLRFKGMNPNAMAFTCETEEELAEKWALIPDDTDILVTHSPPWGLLDFVDNQQHCGNYSAGSKALINRIMDIRSIKLHVFGHIHEEHGVIDDKLPGHRIFVNASHVNELYEPVNKPIRVIL